MAWIESHESLPSHPKTKRMCRLLKITPVVAVGHLHFLWWWAMNHAQDGSLDRYSADDIADACSWDGDSELFFNALIESKFVDRTSSGYSIHDWYDYAGKLIELRKKDAERKRNSRGKKEESEGHPVDIPRTSDGSLKESIRDLNPNPNLDLNQKIKDAVKPEILIQDEYVKLHNKFSEHVTQKEIMAINDLIKTDIPTDFILSSMHQIYREKMDQNDPVGSFLYYPKPIKQLWKDHTTPKVVYSAQRKNNEIDWDAIERRLLEREAQRGNGTA